ncbi:hypothetical protein FACS1894156_0300 [Bacteroidia bacterium]|nr:hypothetical protein FACS1894156_0300 [Bacteroidia bacterium]
MKNKIFYAALLALPFALYSCDKDDSPEKELTPAELVNAIYGPLQTLSSSYSFLVESATETTVSFEDPDNAAGPLVSQLDILPDNWYAIKVFNRLYKSIALANTAIEKIGALEVPAKISQADQDLFIARAKFIRGYNYFQLVQLYGEVPLILTTDASSTDKTSRQSIEAVYAQIVSDLTAAIDKLPEVDNANKSNPSQLAAKTILAKAYLTWGSKPLSASEVSTIASSQSDPAKPDADAAKLQQAITYANAVIESGKYNLLSNFNLIWGVTHENNSEVIFSIHHDGDGIDAQGNHQTHCGFTFPTDERAEPHIQYADITLENAIPDGDARKLYSYVTHVSYEKSGDAIDTLTWPLSIVRPGKWIHRKTDGTNIANGVDVQLNDIDHIDFRLAEVYLIKAEAQFYANQGDKGLAAVNALRSRAGVATLGAITEDALQAEWGYEFAFEQKHWINLVRWRTLLSSVLTKVPTYEYYKQPEYTDSLTFVGTTYNDIPADPTRFSFYKHINKHLRAKVANIKGRNYRFPIPLDENLGSLGIAQNPGY